jgi:hypothetical protein
MGLSIDPGTVAIAEAVLRRLRGCLSGHQLAQIGSRVRQCRAIGPGTAGDEALQGRELACVIDATGADDLAAQEVNQ